jgi:hypothetical protein
MKESLRMSSVLLACGLTACGDGHAPVAVVGADRDAHGCIGSAGYRWCAATARCERPWELAQAKSLELTADSFEKFCAGTE